MNSRHSIHGDVSDTLADSSAGRTRPALRGRHVGLVCADPRAPEVVDLQKALAELGARMSLVRMPVALPDTTEDVERSGMLLGRLYDAVVCVGVEPSRVGGWARASGIPVVGDVVQRWDTLRATVAPAGDEGRFLLRALLLSICA